MLSLLFNIKVLIYMYSLELPLIDISINKYNNKC